MKLTSVVKRKIWVVLVLSFILSLGLELYTFGFPDGFFLRWLRSLFVFLFLLALPVFAIIPFANKVFSKWRF